MLLEILVFLLSLSVIQRSSAFLPASLPIQPRVSFWCGKVNQHVSLANGDWVTDNDGVSGCVDPADKIAIVRYCQKTYRHLTITDARQDSERMIKGWCERGNVNCNHRSSKLTFICVGNYAEAPRLEVPNGCRFSHLYVSHHCKNEKQWQRAASVQCGRDGHTLYSHGMLVQCGLNLHRGVEFVCCPTKEPSPSPSAVPKLPVMPTEDTQPEPTAEKQPESVPVPDMSEPLRTVEMTRHPILHHVFGGGECSRKVVHDQYKSKREKVDTKQRHELRAIVGQYRREKEAADQLRERQPLAAEKMMGNVRRLTRVKVESAGRVLSLEHHGLKKEYKHQLALCYEQKLCTAVQMFSAVLSENRQEAAKIVHDVATVIRNQVVVQHQKVQTEQKISETGSEEYSHAEAAMKHLGRRLQDENNFTMAFMLVARRMLHGLDTQLPNCPPLSTPEEETPIPDIWTTPKEETPIPDIWTILEPGPVMIEPVEEVTKAPETSKPSSSVPDISLILEPGPVLLDSEKTQPPKEVTEQVTPEPTVEELEAKETEQPEPEETDQSEGETADTVSEDADTFEAAVDVEQSLPDERHHQHHTGHHNHIVDDGHEVPIKDHNAEPHKIDISNKQAVFVNDKPRDSIDNKERLDSSSTPSRSYVGVAVGLASGTAVLAVAFLIVYTIRKRYFGDQRVETSIADDERSIHEMEADLQDHGFVNPTYKLFDEMEDSNE